VGVGFVIKMLILLVVRCSAGLNGGISASSGTLAATINKGNGLGTGRGGTEAFSLCAVEGAG
jgi:hypothetical protein